MNSVTDKPARLAGLLALLGAVAAFGLLASGCSDYGPTNLYSKTVFGQTQTGGSLVFSSREFSLSFTAGVPTGVGPDQYVVSLRNVGSGALVGPVNMTVTATAPAGCSGLVLESYTNQPGAPGTGAAPATPGQVVTFGYAGQAIYPGDVLVGNASDPARGGPYQYSFQVGFVTDTAGCSFTAQTFDYVASDSKGDTWSGTFNGTNE